VKSASDVLAFIFQQRGNKPQRRFVFLLYGNSETAL
jgi:hypothetical protein